MEAPPLPPSPKLRLMCSYGGHIVPRPNDKSLFYAGGETRIVSLDRRTTAASLSALTAHLSRSLFHNRPFYLKYQLPNEDLDSLISVVTDEDLSIMIDEHDQITGRTRIRLFLFPVKAESLGSSLLDPKSESWFSDALKGTRIMQSADSGLLMGSRLGSEGLVETGSKLGAESLVLETSSSFGSTGSSVSHSQPVVSVSGEDSCGMNSLTRIRAPVRVPSSASIDSENSAGGASPRTGHFQEPLIQVSSEASSFLVESHSTGYDPSMGAPGQNSVPLLGYPLSQQQCGQQIQQETQLTQGGMKYLPQYPAAPMSMSPYYPVYQMPMQQQQPCPQNQPYPTYLVPVKPSQNHNMFMQSNSIDTNNTYFSSRPPLYPQTSTICPTIYHKEVTGAQPVAEPATKAYRNVPASTTVVSLPSNQGQLVTGTTLESQNLCEPITTDSIASATQCAEIDEDIAYNQIYKSQPSQPILHSQYQSMTNGITMVLSESSVQLQPNHAKQQAALFPV